MKAPNLLGPDEPAAVIEHRAAGASSLFFVCDHAGRRIPRVLNNLGVGEADLARHIAIDVGIAGVARRLSDRLDAALVMQPYSRLVIDCNRPPGAATSILALSEDTPIPGNENVAEADAESRAREIFVPYHQAIERQLDARRGAGRDTILVSLHSFTPVYAGIPRPWHGGVLYNRDPRLAHALLELWRASGDFIVGDNEPYSVSDDTDYTIPVHGEKRRLTHVAIEIRNDLIADEAGQTEWAERMADLLPRAAVAIPAR